MTRLVTALVSLLMIFAQAAAQKPVTPLFAQDNVLEVRFTAPFSQLLRDMEADEPPRFEGLMVLGGPAGEEHAVTLQARGNFRRDRSNCRFPPLRMRIKQKPEDASLFDRQRSLKLVTHCRDRATYRDYVLAEYTAYRLFNLMTEASLKVRLLNATYVDSESGEIVAQQTAFFIEDIDDLADRLGLQEIEIEGTTRGSLAADAAGRLAVFQYMIGNIDWSVLNGREGDACCHNMKLVATGEDATSGIVPIPYDFDHSGLVDAGYAEPPDNLGMRSITDRRFRGFCEHQVQARAAVADSRGLAAELRAVIAATPGLSPRKRRRMEGYLERYFRDVRSEEAVERNLISDCR